MEESVAGGIVASPTSPLLDDGQRNHIAKGLASVNADDGDKNEETSLMVSNDNTSRIKCVFRTVLSVSGAFRTRGGS